MGRLTRADLCGRLLVNHMEILIATPKLQKSKKSENEFLIFSVAFRSGAMKAYITGWRIFNNCILPPMVRNMSLWRPVFYTDITTARALYDVIEASDWPVRFPGVFPLEPFEIAAKDLLLTTQTFQKLFPEEKVPAVS